MILDRLEEEFADANERIHSYIDRFVEAKLLGRAVPPFSVPVEPKRTPTARKAPRRIKATLNELLENVEEAFESASLPMKEYSHLPHDLAVAVRRLGPWVPFGSPWYDDDKLMLDHIAKEQLSILPGLFCLSRGKHDQWSDGVDLQDGHYGTVAFVIGNKLEKAPWYVEQIKGIHFDFWMGFRLKKKVMWVNAQFVINEKTGAVRPIAELHTQYIPLPVGGYQRRIWRTPLIDESTTWGGPRSERSAVACDIFVRVLQWWMRRNERWIVSVRKNKQRVTFSVEKSLTKDFFADRDKTAVTADGKRKKIIHFVREHERATERGTTTVREHIRGLERFDWRGYACSVTAPKFHTWTVGAFTLGGIDEQDAPPKTKMIAIPEVAAFLAKSEDVNTRIKPRPRAKSS